MNQYFIKKYIDKLTIDDIKTFAAYHHITISTEECNYLLKIIKENYTQLLYDDPGPIFNEAKKHLNESTLQVAIELYHFYKEKYQSFL